MQNYHHHTTTAVLRPFFRDHPGEPCQKRTSGLIVEGEINRGRHTGHPAGRHSIRTNQSPPPPSPIIHVKGFWKLDSANVILQWLVKYCILPVRFQSHVLVGLFVCLSTVFWAYLGRAGSRIWEEGSPGSPPVEYRVKVPEDSLQDKVPKKWSSANLALPSVLWSCWLGGRKGIWHVKKYGGMVEVGTG